MTGNFFGEHNQTGSLKKVLMSSWELKTEEVRGHWHVYLEGRKLFG